MQVPGAPEALGVPLRPCAPVETWMRPRRRGHTRRMEEWCDQGGLSPEKILSDLVPPRP